MVKDNSPTDACSETVGPAHQLCLLMEYAPASIAMFNRKMEYLAATRRWRETFRLDGKDIFGHSHYQLVPDIPDGWKSEYQRCLHGEAIQRHADYIERADGTSDWLWRELHPWFDESGDVGGIIVFNEIVTERKRAADELERNRQFLKAILENIQDGIVACDEEGRLNVFNPAAKRILNADLMTVPLEQWASKFRIYGANGKTVPGSGRLPIVRALHGEPMTNEEFIIAPVGESPRSVVASAQQLIGRDDNRIGAVVTMHDVTESREIEARYQQAQKMEAIGQLTGGLAHDFNNLLAVIIGNLQLVLRAKSEDRKSAQRVEAAISAAQRGADLTNRLLAFARKQPLAAKPLDANAYIAGLEDLLSGTLGKGIAIETRLDDKLWTICVDSSQLETAILNLAINARDAMQTGGHLTIETRNVTFSEERPSHLDMAPGDYVAISISDIGRGMPEGIRAKAPEPFFTTKELGKGSGLGLSIVYGFVRQSGGQLNIESEEGRGTTVTMYFPRSWAKVARREEHHPMPKTGDRSKRILIVEDDPAVRQTAVALLEDLGYLTEEAADGDTALETLRSSGYDFDLLLTDIVMPGRLNGPALVKAAREQFPDIRALFISGYAGAAVSGECELHGQIDLINKPFRREDLAYKVGEALNIVPGAQIRP